MAMTLDELLEKRRSVRKYQKRHFDVWEQTSLLYACTKAPSAGGIRGIHVSIRDGMNLFDMKITKQKFIIDSSFVIIFSADIDRYEKRYGKRGNRYALLEIGHMAQNLCLKAVELGLATCCIGAFKDRKLKAFLKIEETPLYMVAVGYPKG